MTLINLLKRGSAILLLISFFLPLSQCTKIDAHENSTPIYESYSAYSFYEWPSIDSSIALLLFSWPVIGQLIALSRRLLISPRIVAAIELLLLIRLSWVRSPHALPISKRLLEVYSFRRFFHFWAQTTYRLQFKHAYL